MRFIRLAGLCAFIALTCFFSEKVVLAYAPTLDLKAHYGPGQSLLYLLVLGCIGLFLGLSRREALRAKSAPAVSPLVRPLRAYQEHKGRVVRGFLAAMLPTLSVTTLCYVSLMGLGALTWKHDALQQVVRHPVIIAQTTASLLIVLVLTTTEELIFRGFVFNYLYTRRRPAVVAGAVVVSSLLFAFVHKFRDFGLWLEPRNWPLFVTLFLLGSLLCLTYLTSESLACSIGVHTGILLPEVFRNQSHLMELHQYAWWLGVDGDIRTAPVTWGLLLLLGALLWKNKARLHAIAAIPEEMPGDQRESSSSTSASASRSESAWRRAAPIRSKVFRP